MSGSPPPPPPPPQYPTAPPPPPAPHAGRPRALVWLERAGSVYMQMVTSGQSADLTLSRRIARDGRMWGRDARRWISAWIFGLSRTRLRTVWAYAAARALGVSSIVSAAADGDALLQRAAVDDWIPARLTITGRAAPPPNAEAYGAPDFYRHDAPNPHLAAEVVWAWLAHPPAGIIRDLLRIAPEEGQRAPTRLETALALATGAGVTLDVPAFDRAARLLDDFCGANPPIAPGVEVERLAWDSSLSLWLARDLCRDHGYDVARAIAVLSESIAPVFLRANTLKTTPADLAARLAEEGHATLPLSIAPDALLLRRRANLFRTRAFEEGLFEVQDVGSQVVAASVDARPGEKVLDFCAGAGGKTLHLAAMMQNRGILWALDPSADRLGRLRERAARAGAYTIRRAISEELPTPLPIDPDPPLPAALAETLPFIPFVALQPLPPEATAVGEDSSPPPASHGPATLNAPAPPAAFPVSTTPPPPTRGPSSGLTASTPRHRSRAVRGLGEQSYVGEAELETLRAHTRTIPAEFDAVLVDAPCSGTGTMRRNPEFAWKMSPARIAELGALQRRILREAARRVRPGGRLLYATCSLFAAENERVVLGFLAEHPEFEGDPLAEPLRARGYEAWAPAGQQFMVLLRPDSVPGDGFFIARMRRRAAPGASAPPVSGSDA